MACFRIVVVSLLLCFSFSAIGEDLPRVNPDEVGLWSATNLAERLVINVNTVVKAYAELVRDGVLVSQQGLGFFVPNKKRQIYSRAERLRRLRQTLDAFVHEAVFLDFTADELREAVDE